MYSRKKIILSFAGMFFLLLLMMLASLFFGSVLLNPKEILDSLSLGKFYKKLINEPFLKRASRYEMMKIALSMPLSNWLGLNTKNRVRMAVDLGFYDKTFNPNIDISKLSHLRGKDLGEHLKVLKELEIKAFLKDKR